MRVPLSPGQQIEDRPLTPPFQQISAPPDAFGAGIAQEVRRAGATLGQAADQLATRAQQVQDQSDATAAQEAYLAANKAAAPVLYDPDKGIAFRQSTAARGMTTDGLKSMEEIGRTTRDALANDRQRSAFDRLWSGRTITEMNQLSRREAAENQTARAEMQKGMIALEQTTAAQNHNDPEAIEAAIGRAEAATRTGTAGQAPELVEAAVGAARSGVIRTAVEARSIDDPLGASADYERLKGRMTGRDMTALGEHLRLPKLRAQAAGIVRAVTGPNPALSGPVPDMVRESARAQGVDVTTALAIGHIESANGTQPDRRGSQYKGVFQMGDAEWAQHGGTAADRADPARQVQLGIANVKASQERARAVLGRQPEGWETYMVHQQGAGGGPALLQADPNQPAVGVLNTLPFYQARPGLAAQAVKGNGGWDGMTVAQFRETWRTKYTVAELSVKPHLVASRDGTMTDASPPAFQAPNRAAMLARARELAGGDPELEQRSVAGVEAYVNRFESETQVKRQALGRDLKDTQAALADGRDVDLQEGRIRALLQPEQADEIMGTLHEARLNGQVLGQVRFMGADALGAALAQAKEGLGPVPDGGTATDVEGYRQRRTAYDRLVKAKEDRDKQLNDDPARYAAQAPAVDALRQAIDPKRPETTVAYVQGSLAEQARLGVPDGKRRAIPVAQADALVGRFTSMDPSQADIGLELNKLATEFGGDKPGGGVWPAVFGDLVKAKLPGMYQVLMAVPDAAVRGALQTGLTVSAQKGGTHKLREAAPAEAVKEVDAGLDAQLAEFRKTTIHNEQGGIELFDRVKDAARLLGYVYTMQGQDGAAAVKAAVTGVLGAYEFDDTMRFPKGQGDDVRTSTRYTAMSLRAEDIQPYGGSENLTPDERKDVVLRGIRNDGKWVPNADSSGLVLMYRTRYSSLLIPVRPAGDPKGKIEVRFDNLPRQAAREAAPPMPYGVMLGP